MSEVRPNYFKIVQLNAENLFIFLDDPTPRDWRKVSEKEWQKLSHATVPNKPLGKVLWLADSLEHIDADIICLNEVGGLESITHFARLFLKDRYVPYLIEGNSDRGIDVGYLIKRDFPLRAELCSYKDRPIDFLYPHERLESRLKSHYFSRDCAELRLFGSDPARPQLILLLVHLKSKLDPDGIDPQGRDRRRAEFTALMRIYYEVRAEFTPPVPIAVVGDFNGFVHADPPDEFAGLKDSELESVVALAGLEGEAVATQLQFGRGNQMTGLQIDYIFTSPELKKYLVKNQVEVYRYHSDLRMPLPLPRTLEQRLQLPSDHFPVVATFLAYFL
jgi:endonuclease/exonuclease/phosphatase family metal-dependent hydrolase